MNLNNIYLVCFFCSSLQIFKKFLCVFVVVVGTFEIDEDTISSSPGSSLSDDDSLHDFLSELGGSLLDRAENHITNGGTGKFAQMSLDAETSDRIKILST